MLVLAELSPAQTSGMVAAMLILVGLGIATLSYKAGHSLLVTVFWWLGLVVAILGGVLLLDPVVHWVATQLRSMLGM